MRAFRKYGIDNFSFDVIEECTVNELNEKEIYWISFYDTFFNGYNQTLGGDNKARQPKEKVIGVINDLKNTNMIHRDIAKKWGMSTEMVQGINTGRYWRHDADYPLQKRAVAKTYYCEDCGKIISRGALRCSKCHNLLNSKQMKGSLLMPDKNELYMELLKNNGNFSLVSKKYGVSDNAIRKWCIKYGLPNHSRDYKTNRSEQDIKLLNLENVV